MDDRFDYDAYWGLIDRLRSTHRALRFTDVSDGFPDDRFFILRHDVDYSTPAALALAEQESRKGVRATYFLLTNGIYYNLLAPEHADVPRRLVELGHEVGLHYDVRFLYRFPIEQRDALVALQLSLLTEMSGSAVRSIAMHQPGLHGADPLAGGDRYINAYNDRFVRGMPYVSDSCRAWRDSAWRLLTAEQPPLRFQLALHPINWSSVDRPREEIFGAVHRELARSVEAAGQILLEQVRRHSGVVEHAARVVRSPLVKGTTC